MEIVLDICVYNIKHLPYSYMTRENALWLNTVLKVKYNFDLQNEMYISSYGAYRKGNVPQLTCLGFKASHSVCILWPVLFSVVFLVEFEHML